LRKYATLTRFDSTYPLRGHLDVHQFNCRAFLPSFYYAFTFIQSRQHRPDDRLNVILGLKQPYARDRPYARLDALYRFIFLEIQDPDQLEKIHRAFGIMHLRVLKCGFFASPRWTSDRQAIEALLDFRPGDLVLLFDPLLSLVTFEKDDIRICHKSFFDYLLDSTRSGDLLLTPALAHESVANHIVRGRTFQDKRGATLFPKLTPFPGSVDIANCTYHCQFAHLNDTLTSHIRFLACAPDVTLTKSLRTPLNDLRLLQSGILSTSQPAGKQSASKLDFIFSARILISESLRKYVDKEIQDFRPACPWNQGWKSMILAVGVL
jgi:hypothetical protein